MKLAIKVEVCRNLESDEEDEEGVEREINELLMSLGRDWVVTNVEFIDEDGWLPPEEYRRRHGVAV